jgi:hypothetical protein
MAFQGIQLQLLAYDSMYVKVPQDASVFQQFWSGVHGVSKQLETCS